MNAHENRADRPNSFTWNGQLKLLNQHYTLSAGATMPSIIMATMEISISFIHSFEDLFLYAAKTKPHAFTLFLSLSFVRTQEAA